MYLKTKNPVTVNTGINGTEEVVLIGALNIEQFNIGSDEASIYGYAYFNSATGEIIEQKSFHITPEEKDLVFTQVKDGLPDINTVGFSEWFKKLTFEGFRFEMSQTLSILPEEILIEEGQPTFGQV